MVDPEEEEAAAAARENRTEEVPGIRPVRVPGLDGTDRGRRGERLPDPERVP